MNEIIAQRVFNPIYIYLDTIFLILLCALMVFQKKYLTLLWSIGGGILYMLVDYGIFHLLLGTRSIVGGDLFWVLLWMSMSYGITNFFLMWIWMSKDKRFIEWTLLIFIWWICCPLISNTFGGNLAPIKIQRTTTSYHGYMAIIMMVSYAILIVLNLFQKDKSKRFNLVWLFIIGVLVQLGWEFSLLIGGIRSAEFASFADKLMTLTVNSLLETNMGMPSTYALFILITKSVTETLKKRQPKMTFMQRLSESNLQKMREDKLCNDANCDIDTVE